MDKADARSAATTLPATARSAARRRAAIAQTGAQTEERYSGASSLSITTRYKLSAAPLCCINRMANDGAHSRRLSDDAVGANFALGGGTFIREGIGRDLGE